MKIGIIGAGIAGLATAARLASRGHQVEVFEANSYPGGKLSAFTLSGYRFDAGPSLFTMPQYVEALFQAADEPMAPYFSYERVPMSCRYFWDDGTDITAWADTTRFAREVEDTLGVPAQTVLRFLSKSEEKYRSAGRIFLEKSLHRVGTWWDASVLRSLLMLPRFDIFSSMHGVHERWFRHPKLVQLFDRYATYNGSDPYLASGMLTIIPHFEHGFGTFHPHGGMERITGSIFELAQKKGAKFHFNTPVTAILTEDGRAIGLKANGQQHRFDAVVSNMDVFYTYRKLLPDAPPPERILGQPKSTSALIFYWGIRREFPQLDLHNIFFSERYREEFETLRKGGIINDPTVYINITSKYTPTDAPDGCENWFVMVNAPCDTGQDWPTLITEVRRNILQKVSQRLGTDVEALIECEEILTPMAIERKTSSHLGALYGYSSNNLMSAFMRHPNFTSRLKDLYFVGGSVHPGGGIPLCLLSAKITDELIAGEA